MPTLVTRFTKPPDKLRRYTAYQTIRFHICSNHGSCSNGRPSSDTDARQDQGARADPAIILNTDGVGEGGAAGFPPDLGIECMGNRADTNVRADQHSIAYKDGGVIVN